MFFGGGIPFRHVFPGGMPAGMGGGAGGSSDKPVNTTKLYEILGVEKSASADEIRKAYMTVSRAIPSRSGFVGPRPPPQPPLRPCFGFFLYMLLNVKLQLARTSHPDRGGDPETFKGVQKAYEVCSFPSSWFCGPSHIRSPSQILKNPEKRALYDEHGEEGVESGGGGGGPRDIFEAMGMRQAAPSGPRKADDLVHPIAVSLEDIYRGKELRVAVSATSYTKDPTGGVMDRAGNRYAKTTERVLLDVTIEKGMMNGQRITFPDKGNSMPGA